MTKDSDDAFVEDKWSEQTRWRRELVMSNGLWNTFALGIGFFLLFVSFGTTQMFETSLSADLGRLSLVILYTAFPVSNLFISSSFVRLVGARRSLVLSATTYCFFVFVHLFDSVALRLFAAFLLGVGAAVLWTAHGVILAYSSTEQTMGKHTGIFFTMFQAYGLLGNLLAAIIFAVDGSDKSGTNILFIILTVIGCLGCVWMWFSILPPPSTSPTTATAPEHQEQEEMTIASVCGSIVKQTKLVMLQFVNRPMVLVTPYTFWMGLLTQYYFGSFTGLLEPKQIGFVMSWYALVSLISSACMGSVVDRLRLPNRCLFGVTAFVVQALALLPITGLSQPPIFIFILAACLFGFAEALIRLALFSYLRSVCAFNDSSAVFSYCYLVQSFATAIAFLLSIFFAFQVMTMFFVCCGFLGVISIYFSFRYLHLTSPSELVVL